MRYVKVKVQGHVQGVGFRYFTRKIAIKYDIAGWVKNKNDGSVVMEARGDEADIAHFLAEIRKGPSRFAEVQEMNVIDLEGDPRFTEFRIKH
ncbi:acylphosphatase [Virgibacillus sp. YIM 98842]|jgi:acylphosphatase|uniref:acylphosphatase n=1 Tax=Virgibacillus sp. YIM 98842 TaxID=2663533 RepID=UPI0013DC8CE4|nr:acylphosphatase [Virgibacillus sp. YIM 98842]